MIDGGIPSSKSSSDFLPYSWIGLSSVTGAAPCVAFTSVLAEATNIPMISRGVARSRRRRSAWTAGALASAAARRFGSISFRAPVVPISRRFDEAPDNRTALGNTSTKDRIIERISAAPDEMTNEERQRAAHQQRDRCEKGERYRTTGCVRRGVEHVPTVRAARVGQHERGEIPEVRQQRRDAEAERADPQLERSKHVKHRFRGATCSAGPPRRPRRNPRCPDRA